MMIESAIKVLWDGDSMLAVEKPAGLSTQSPPGNDSLESRLRTQLSGRSDYFAVVHRLDRPVSGVVLIALRKRVAKLLSEQFATRKVDKHYLAVVEGNIEPVEQLWTDYLRKVPNQPRAERVTENDPDAKFAETRVEVVRYCSKLDRTLVRLFPHTGRMHQLRIQSALRGHRILGDSLYDNHDSDEDTIVSENRESDLTRASAGLPSPNQTRIMLHAESITFHHPKSGVRVTVQCPADELQQIV
ncbi:tRNA pseudouridine synthase C [Rhodopirellula maiorica SM1]|uniref:tRNA pseudouridine synthase C n=1 Tax=Rhodopirellula maiorica SM1 TaxID=1265738 RepID=M5RE33_9BACT|nr:RluA family pseudouridine synthase [Rhodopirellula maiorica]EMI17321.1 tRNA pseudouridine synthase C [Rhodopirellula maiorica SM1]